MNTQTSSPVSYRFSFGPWNISEGADPFGPDTRKPIAFSEKLPIYQNLGFEGVRLNDQNGLKFDQDKAFGAVDLRRASNQVRVLEEAGYGSKGEFIGIDVKALRTTKGPSATQHLSNSKGFFLSMVNKVRTLDRKQEAAFIAERDYEGLERFIVNHLLGV